MGVDWDKHLLGPLHNVFAEKARWEPVKSAKGAEFYDIDGIFDRAYFQNYESTDGESGINTTRPILGVRDVIFTVPPAKGDRVFLYSVSTLFVVSDVQPDSHGGTHLILNKVK
ncbi:head-tail joining protein [Morganella morganii]|uniref:head-tail joining protein n=1 Tax=Morganella morganii TaxID=582 RepID=UPI000666DB9E|nr:hypothetical protein [Morganella morganii]AMG70231.1 hypothetical protein AL531_07680 [Morganella morganii]EJD6112036.1 hypothetical protein [Morganella morganii]EJK8625905.1 hypothetical protein [Morganella morganii]EKU4015889.1 hypothetical protein [Morganella morganii]EKU5663273.1 hypothetical protein [Morganella morganii]